MQRKSLDAQARKVLSLDAFRQAGRKVAERNAQLYNELANAERPIEHFDSCDVRPVLRDLMDEYGDDFKALSK